MGKKRKRGQAKQNWSSTNSWQQKKRRKTRGYGFNQAKVPNHESRDKLSNTMDCNVLELKPEKSSSSSSVCNIFWSNLRLRVCGISAIFSRLNNCADLFQSSTMRCFRSIKNLFLFLNWLKQIFGCGLQTLGKFLLAERDQVTSADRPTHLEKMIKRVETLEEEVKSLKSELFKKTTCSCGDHSSGSATQTTYMQTSFPLEIPPPPPCPPPPPPPPPPVLPAAAPPLAFLKNKQTKSKATDAKENKNKTARTLVTLEDLKKVKLRKVNQAIEKDKENAAHEFETTSLQSTKPSLNKLNQRNDVQCVVSLREITNVALKRTKRETEVEKIKLRTPEEMVVMRRNLRKVNITRSPGGTPLLSDKSCEHGTGLTPMITRALRRKFQQAHPYSSPDSPTGKQKRQSLSPMVVSPSTPSPSLLIKN